MGMGHFYVSIWIKKHLQKYDQEWHLLIKHDWYYKSLCYLAINLEKFK